MKSISKGLGLLLGLALMMTFVFAASSDSSSSLKVSNATSKKINGLRVSADGQRFQLISLNAGIKPGQAVDVTWDRGEQCEWLVKAVYADRSESSDQEVNTCANNAAVEFH